MNKPLLYQIATRSYVDKKPLHS